MLNHISESRCPVCLSPPVKDEVECYEGKINVHVNGGRWEHRRFSCGLRISYIPNFGRNREGDYQITSVCLNSLHEKEKAAKRKEAANKLRDFINNLDVDEEWKKDATRRIC